MNFSIDDIGLKVGLEIHQQLDTSKKLFCNCMPIESDEYTFKFMRKLRASKSEMGEYDPAALFERTKSKTIMYYANQQSSCLVERDDEPPHDLDLDAKKIALLIATALESHVFTEIYPMRKMVIDGSNTTGFQRTMLISQGGLINVNGMNVGVQSICLEEDAAKLLNDSESSREYSLDRLGIPLVEIALEPVSATPAEMKKIALALGRLLRTTKMVARGLGTIRQDVNVSINGGGIIEVKGVQQLDQLEKVVEYEAKRQHGLLLIAKKIQEKNIEKISKNNDVFDVTEIFKKCGSKIIQKALKENAIISAIKIKNFSGLFGFSPYDDIRLGKELGQLVKLFGIGGVFHSDELPNYGIENSHLEEVKKMLKINPEDGYLIIASPSSKMNFVLDSIINRIDAAKIGPPTETRLAKQNGETVYLRPRPGASRMYPETDIPPVKILESEIQWAKNNIPKTWDESLLELEKTYGLNKQLAEQIFDSEYIELFEKISRDKKISATFVASVLCSTITNLQRQGYDPSLLKFEEIEKSFKLLADDKITKESIEMIFENIMSGKSNSVDDVIEKFNIGGFDEKELIKIIDDLVLSNKSLIEKQGQHALGPLMGMAMKSLRGKVSGEKLNSLLKEKIEKLSQ